MKRKFFAAALLCAAGAATAQSVQSVQSVQTVQIYGVLDTGVEYLNNVGATSGSVIRVPTLTGGQLPSRLGFRGSEDLGGGLRAVCAIRSDLTGATTWHSCGVV